MGGRRAGNLLHLVGSGGKVTAAKRELTRAVSAADPDAIAEASTRLIASSEVGLDAFRYGLKLAPYIAENLSQLGGLADRDRIEAIRKAWGELKRRENIKASPELDSAVITAATEAFRGGG